MPTTEVEGGGRTVNANNIDLIRYPLVAGDCLMAEARIVAKNQAGAMAAFTLRHYGKFPATEVGVQTADSRLEVNNLQARIRIVAQGVVVECLGVAGHTVDWWGWLTLWIKGNPPP